MDNTFIVIVSAIGLYIGYIYLSKTQSKTTSVTDKISNGFNGIFGSSTLDISKVAVPTDPEKLRMYNLALQSIQDSKTRVIIKLD